MKKIPILTDLGERRILREIIPKYACGVGDDCAVVDWSGGRLVITTDPVPPPAATVLGGDPDLYWTGWLLVTINASDIAASGAKPQAFVAALDLPSDLPTAHLERLLTGIRDACAAHNLDYVGGNLREAPKLAAVGTAIGSCDTPPITRSGAKPGDLAVVIGLGGRFWADALRLELGISVNRSASPVFAPVAQVAAMQRLHAAGLIECAMDTSDGLAPSLYEIAAVNRLSIDIDLALIRSSSSSSDVPERPERLWMGWGDWTVLAAVDPNNMTRVTELTGGASTVIGTFAAGNRGVTLHDAGRSTALGRLESERFATDSWFVTGIQGYLRLLRELPLP